MDQPELHRETTWRPVWGKRPRTVGDPVMVGDPSNEVSVILGFEQIERYTTDWTRVDPQPQEMEAGHGPGTVVRS